MTKRLGMAAFVGSILVIAAAYASAFLPGEPPGWAAWALALGSCVALVAMTVVGAARNGRVGRRLSAAFALVLTITAGGFAVLLALPPADAADPTLLLGLPPRAAVLLYGIGLLPFLVVPVAYAWTFDDFTLSEADLARVRAAAAEGAASRVAVASAGDPAEQGTGDDGEAGGRSGASFGSEAHASVQAASGARGAR